MKGFNMKVLHYQILVFLSYFMLWVPMWLFSTNFETISASVSWFIPAGIRITYLLFLPRKYWLSIYLSEMLATSFVTLHFASIRPDNFPQIVFHVLVMISMYMLCCHLYLKRFGHFRIDSIRHLIGLLGWLVPTLILSALFYFLNRTEILQDGIISLFEFAFAFVLGDLTGIMVILIPFSILRYLWNSAKNRHLIIRASSYSVILLMSLLMIHSISPDIAKHASVIALFFFTILAYQYGLLGAGLSVTVIFSFFVLSNLLQVSVGTPLDNQLFILAASLIAVFLGVAATEQRALAEDLRSNNSQLEQANKALEKLSNQLKLNLKALNLSNKQLLSAASVNEDLATRLVNIQETERTQIARDLHDHIGQNITAIKINLTLLKSTVQDQQTKDLVLQNIDIADAMYDSTQHIINLLHPRVVDELGLEEALSERVLGIMLAKKDITYNVSLNGDLSRLKDKFAIVIYRIAQEAINNTIKHAHASEFNLFLDVNDHWVYFTLADNGMGFDVEQQAKGTGLTNIRDRVSALAGTHRLMSDSSGTCHEIKFAFA